MVFVKFDILPQDEMNAVAYAAGVIVALLRPTTFIFMNAGEILVSIRNMQRFRAFTRSNLCYDLSECVSVIHIHLALRIPWVIQYFRHEHGYEFEMSRSEGTKFHYSGTNFESRQLRKKLSTVSLNRASTNEAFESERVMIDSVVSALRQLQPQRISARIKATSNCANFRSSLITTTSACSYITPRCNLPRTSHEVSRDECFESETIKGAALFRKRKTCASASMSYDELMEAYIESVAELKLLRKQLHNCSRNR